MNVQDRPMNVTRSRLSVLITLEVMSATAAMDLKHTHSSSAKVK